MEPQVGWQSRFLRIQEYIWMRLMVIWIIVADHLHISLRLNKTLEDIVQMNVSVYLQLPR